VNEKLIDGVTLVSDDGGYGAAASLRDLGAHDTAAIDRLSERQIRN
jgi:hypothetical protein